MRYYHGKARNQCVTQKEKSTMKSITIALFLSLSHIPGVFPQRPRVLIVEPKTFRVR